MTATENSAVAVVKEAINAFQVADYVNWANYYADDAVIDDLGSGTKPIQLRGKQEILAWFKTVADSWADSTYKPLRIIAQGNSVLWEWQWEGTQTQDFVDAFGSGGKVNFRGNTIWDIEDGKIKKEVTLYNYSTLLDQLGNGETEAVAAARGAVAAFQKPDPEVWVNFYAEDALLEDFGSGTKGETLRGRDQILNWFRTITDSWPDATYKTLYLFGQESAVVWAWQWEGIQKKGFLDATGAGNKVNILGMTIWEVENGKFKRERTTYNYSNFLDQLMAKG